MNITIRKATIDDWIIVQRLNNEVFEDNMKYDTYLNKDWPFTQEGISHYKKAVSSSDHCTFIAFDGDLPVGHVVGGPKIISFRDVKMAEIVEIGVSPEYRSSGVGSKLVDALKEWAKESGYQVLIVNSYATNNKAIAFYKKQGLAPNDINLEMEI
jgi:ribosomal protein S18 acetylase RimI-like enzyme